MKSKINLWRFISLMMEVLWAISMIFMFTMITSNFGSMKKIIKFEVETGMTASCEVCPFGVRRFDSYLGEYEYICNIDKQPFDCGKYNLTTIKPIQEDEN